MKSYILLIVALLLCNAAVAQNRLTAVIRDAGTGEALAGASAMLKGPARGGASGENGIATVENIPDGVHTVEFSHLGYESARRMFTFPLPDGDTVEVLLESATAELEEIVVSSTRSTRTIESIPTRIEFIGAEELDEKGNMKPGDIRMLLNESTGIRTQQTSPISANASIRIQGLDGRYTQILKDGLPLYSGAASGLGLLQIPPLDLRQVEIVKGSSSTLYGGGAIAGMVNLISKTPDGTPELSFLVNGTSALGLDVSGFYSQKYGRTGLTLFAARNSSEPYDPAGAGLSAIPEVERYTFNPRLFVAFSDGTKADFGIDATFENRLGGDMLYLKGRGGDGYFERNKTGRVSTQFSLEHRFSDRAKMSVRNSYSRFRRTITIPDYVFDGVQNGSFSEVNYSYAGRKTEWVTGANLWTDYFRERRADGSFASRNYGQTTAGVFVQNLTEMTGWFSLETGLRGDYVAGYDVVFLPRLSALFTISRKWTSRIGGGLGYKSPTIFTEESERIQYRNVLPVSHEANRLERSYGVNADINYRTVVADAVTFSMNQLFFHTRLNNPLMLIPLPDGALQFRNIDGHTATKGAETNLKIGCDDFKLFLGYTLTDAVVSAGGVRRQNPLTPKHRVNAVLMYEVEEKWRAGLEAYYNSRQSLNDGTTGRTHWIFGAMAERIWEHFSLFVNFENFTDTRQTRFGSIYTGPPANPVFLDIYAPLDGFVVNGGIKLRF
jgi:iron complex outermembrane receptor protein